MRGKITMMLMALTLMSCSKEGKVGGVRDLDYDYGKDLSHGAIVLGDRLENPYKTENITKALQSLYPTKADRVDVRTTDLYVRFLPESEEEYDRLVIRRDPFYVDGKLRQYHMVAPVLDKCAACYAADPNPLCATGCPAAALVVGPIEQVLKQVPGRHVAVFTA